MPSQIIPAELRNKRGLAKMEALLAETEQAHGDCPLSVLQLRSDIEIVKRELEEEDEPLFATRATAHAAR